MTEKNLKIEVLFPQACNLFGDLANVEYLKKCLPKATFFETDLGKKPLFLSEKIDFVYMGACTENTQIKIIEMFSFYKDEIKRKIEEGVLFFFTGNSFEIFGNYIEKENGEKIKALSIFDFWVKQNLTQRHNSECEMKVGDIKVYAFKSQFTMCYPKDENNSLFDVVKGIGMNMESKKEGIFYKNFLATYLIGPILILNPDFTKLLIKKMGINNPVLAFEDEVYSAFKKRAMDFDKNVPDKPAKYKYM